MYLPLATDGFAFSTLVMTDGRVLDQLVGGKRKLAHRHMHERALVGAELDLTSLHFLHCLGDVHGDGSRLRIRHQAARTEHLTQTAHRTHHVGRGDHGIVVGPAFFLDLLHQVFAAEECRRRPLRPRAAFRPWPARALSSSCPVRAAEPQCREPSGRRAWGRHPDAGSRSTVSSNLANLIFCNRTLRRPAYTARFYLRARLLNIFSCFLAIPAPVSHRPQLADSPAGFSTSCASSPPGRTRPGRGWHRGICDRGPV